MNFKEYLKEYLQETYKLIYNGEDGEFVDDEAFGKLIAAAKVVDPHSEEENGITQQYDVIIQLTNTNPSTTTEEYFKFAKGSLEEIIEDSQENFGKLVKIYTKLDDIKIENNVLKGILKVTCEAESEPDYPEPTDPEEETIRKYYGGR
jgi:hypothetical protein